MRLRSEKCLTGEEIETGEEKPKKKSLKGGAAAGIGFAAPFVFLSLMCFLFSLFCFFFCFILWFFWFFCLGLASVPFPFFFFLRIPSLVFYSRRMACVSLGSEDPGPFIAGAVMAGASVSLVNLVSGRRRTVLLKRRRSIANGHLRFGP